MPPPWGQRLGAGTRGLGSRWCCRQVVAEAGTCPPPCLSAWTSVSGLKLASWLFPAAPCPPGPGFWPGQGSCGHPPRSVPVPSLAAPTMPARLFGEESNQFVFIQNHLRSHFGEMKREKRAPRAWPAGCPLVPSGALGGRCRHPFPRPSPPPRRAVAQGPRAACGLSGGQALLICMKRTLEAHLQRRN